MGVVARYTSAYSGTAEGHFSRSRKGQGGTTRLARRGKKASCFRRVSSALKAVPDVEALLRDAECQTRLWWIREARESIDFESLTYICASRILDVLKDEGGQTSMVGSVDAASPK